MKFIATAAALALSHYSLAESVNSSSGDDPQANEQTALDAIRDACMEQDENMNYIRLFSEAWCEEYRPGARSSGVVPSPGARKLKQLKMLVLWLQPEHRFARYCYYGCWCLPDDDHAEFTPAYGKPVDEIDASCKKMSQCYQCAKMDHGEECNPTETGYKYELHQDPNDPTNHWKNSITCLDNWEGKKACRRSICECDKKLAEDLRTNFGYWKQGHHQTQGDFDTAECQVNHCTGAGCNAKGPVECCGSHDGPRFPFKTNQGQRACCGNKTYDSTMQECCNGDEVKFMGAC